MTNDNVLLINIINVKNELVTLVLILATIKRSISKLYLNENNQHLTPSIWN